MGKCDRHAVPASPAPLTPQMRVRGYARRRSYAVRREAEMPGASGAPLRRRSPRAPPSIDHQHHCQRKASPDPPLLRPPPQLKGKSPHECGA